MFKKVSGLIVFLQCFYILTPYVVAAPRYWTSSEHESVRKTTTRELLEIVLGYDEKTAQPFSFIEATRKKTFHPKTSRRTTHVLKLLDDNNVVLESQPFQTPSPLQDPPPLPNDTQRDHVTHIPDKIVVLVPWNNRTSQIQVETINGETLTSYSLPQTPPLDENVQEYFSVQGDSLNETDRIQTQDIDIQTVNDPRLYLDILFLGDDYSQNQLGTFHSDVDRISKHILTYEPFRTRSARVIFRYIDNTSDLGCHHDATIQRLIICNSQTVYQVANSAGVPYDEIIVLYNDSEYGGSGGSFAVSYNGPSAPEVSIHEFGHSFGHLHDEYTLSKGGTLDNMVVRNCYKGIPPASEWQGIVSLSDYTRGCMYENWYRSSPNSIMYSLSARYFNPVSQILLNQELDYATRIAIPADTNNNGILELSEWQELFRWFYANYSDMNGDGTTNSIDYATIRSIIE